MEIMEGGSLYDIIHEEKCVPWSMLQKVCKKKKERKVNERKE